MRRREMGVWLATGVLTVGLAGCNREPTTPEEKRAKAEALLQTMSASLGGAPSLTVETTEVTERVRTGGAKAEETLTRQIAIHRPDGAYFKVAGPDHENEMWYDGKRVTLAMHKQKAWARGPMPATLDEALDALATEYAIFLGAADLFYSKPYDAFEESQSTGGWVGQETIDGATCDHLAFQGANVDWEIWLAATPQALPCRMKLTHKQEAGSPTSTLTFRNWNLSPTIADGTFAAKVDPAYERLYMVRAPTAEPEPADEEAPAEAPTASPK